MTKDIDEYTFGRRLDREPGMEFPEDTYEDPNENEEEEIEEESEEDETNDLQSFMDDMSMLNDQLKSGKIKTPPYNFADLGVTNYLLWLVLAELKKGGEE